MFAGYLISAAAGLNEPPSLPVAVGSELDSAARSIAGSGDLSPLLFSHAWQCALEVIDGRITGLVSVTFEATPALLVYARHQGKTHVAIVPAARTIAHCGFVDRPQQLRHPE